MMSKKKKRRGRKGADPHGFAKGDRVKHLHQITKDRVHGYEGEIVDIGRTGYQIRFDEVVPGQRDHVMWCQRATIQLIATKEELRRQKAPKVATLLGDKLKKVTEPEAPVVDMAKKRLERELKEWEAMRTEAQQTFEDAVDEERGLSLRIGELASAAEAREGAIEDLEERIAKLREELEGYRASEAELREAWSEAKQALRDAQSALVEWDALKPTAESVQVQVVEPKPKASPKVDGVAVVTEPLYPPPNALPFVRRMSSQGSLQVARLVADLLLADRAVKIHSWMLNEYFEGVETASNPASYLGNLLRNGVLTPDGMVRRDDPPFGSRSKIHQYAASQFLPEDLSSIRPLTASELAKGGDDD